MQCVFEVSRDYLRYGNGDRFVDVYYEGNAKEIFLDEDSIRAWHTHKYLSPIEVIRQNAYLSLCTLEEADLVLSSVITMLSAKYPRARISTRKGA